MSRKHVLFKCVSHPPQTPAFGQQAELELGAKDIKAIKVQTVFGLVDFPDLKLVISKSIELQRQLSAHLAETGCYGFIWSGEHLPDLQFILSTSPFFESCFIFQRSTDPPPELTSSGFSMMQKETEVYNWHVFRFGSLVYTLQQLCRIREWVPNEIELDRQFRRFRQSLVAPGSDKYPLLKKTWPEVQPFHLNGILNYLQAVSPGPIELWNAPESVQNILSASSGGELYFVEFPDVQSLPNHLYAAIREKRLPEFQTALSGLLSGLRMLLLSNGEQQADLFMDRIEQSFLTYWEQQKPRLEAAGLPIKMQKGFAAARFLIEQKVVSESQPVLDFLRTALMRTVQKPGRKADGNDFSARLQTTLNELLRFAILLDKIQPLLLPEKTRWNYERLSVENQSTAALFFPLSPYPGQNWKRGQYINILFENPLPDWPDEHIIWHDEIALHGPFYNKLGGYGQALFNHLYARELKQEAVHLFYAWVQIYEFLNERIETAGDGFRIALIFPYILPYHQAGSKECPLKRIVLEWIELEHIPYETDQVFEWEDQPEDTEISSILIVKKQINESL